MEFSLIERIRRRLGRQADVLLGMGDDAAIVVPPAGEHLVVTTDTLVAGVHYPSDTAPADIGWKALAVNLSDLAAMAAQPRWVTLSLTLEQANSDWLDAFLDGFLALAQQHSVALIGGDTTRGPQAIGVTAMGSVPPDQALRRDAAQVDDDIWVTGTLGDAAAALSQWRSNGAISDCALAERLNRPLPRIDAGLALRGVAHAAIDVSDGLLADLRHVLDASGCGAELELDLLPASTSLADISVAQRQRLQLTGGDDYELCFTAPSEQRVSIVAAMQDTRTVATRIGRVRKQAGVVLRDASGAIVDIRESGYQHFLSQQADS